MAQAWFRLTGEVGVDPGLSTGLISVYLCEPGQAPWPYSSDYPTGKQTRGALHAGGVNKVSRRNCLDQHGS